MSYRYLFYLLLLVTLCPTPLLAQDEDTQQTPSKRGRQDFTPPEIPEWDFRTVEIPKAGAGSTSRPNEILSHDTPSPSSTTTATTNAASRSAPPPAYRFVSFTLDELENAHNPQPPKRPRIESTPINKDCSLSGCCTAALNSLQQILNDSRKLPQIERKEMLRKMTLCFPHALTAIQFVNSSQEKQSHRAKCISMLSKTFSDVNLSSLYLQYTPAEEKFLTTTIHSLVVAYARPILNKASPHQFTRTDYLNLLTFSAMSIGVDSRIQTVEQLFLLELLQSHAPLFAKELFSDAKIQERLSADLPRVIREIYREGRYVFFQRNLGKNPLSRANKLWVKCSYKMTCCIRDTLKDLGLYRHVSTSQAPFLQSVLHQVPSALHAIVGPQMAADEGTWKFKTENRSFPLQQSESSPASSANLSLLMEEAYRAMSGAI